MKKIILASSSPRRIELLRQLGINFEIIVPDTDEMIDSDKAAEDIARQLALEKAEDVLKNRKKPFQGEISDYLVIGADTVVVSDGVIGKPADEESACKMLKQLQGKWHEVITGIAVLNPVSAGKAKKVIEFERTRVKMKTLGDDEIRSYISTGEPFDKAGAYGIQGKGAVLIEKIEGCYFNVVGLPIARLTEILKKFNVSVWDYK